MNGATVEQYNITMRRYACMALTNLTFGDGTNKALLCSMKLCMLSLVAQLQSSNEDLRQVAASVLRNLSWRADLASKKTLREVGAVTALMQVRIIIFLICLKIFLSFVLLFFRYSEYHYTFSLIKVVSYSISKPLRRVE